MAAVDAGVANGHVLGHRRCGEYLLKRVG